MRTTGKIMSVFFVLLAVGVGNLSAEIITIYITAEIVEAGVGGLFDGRIEVGDIITGSYTYDSDAPDSEPSNPNGGDYYHYSPPYGISLSVVGAEVLSKSFLMVA